MLNEYFPVLIFIGVGLAMGVLPVLAGKIFSVSKPNSEKNSPYECGFAAFDNARIPFDVRFYLVAILFILFDLETAFLVPWAVMFKKIGLTGVLAMALFLLLLLIGFVYEWRKGALEWE